MAEYESHQWFPDVTTVNDCVKSFQDWKNKRAEIRWFLDDFEETVVSQVNFDRINKSFSTDPTSKSFPMTKKTISTSVLMLDKTTSLC